MDKAAGQRDQASHEGSKAAPLVFQYPDEARLLARGRYETLWRERRDQIERVQTIVTTITSEAHGVLRDCQRKSNETPQEPQRMQTLTKCLENLHTARERIHTLCLGLQELEEEAWGK